MSLNRIFKTKMWKYDWADTFAYLHGTKNPHKKRSRKMARKIFKQDKFYNGFYEFVEMNRKKNDKWDM